MGIDPSTLSPAFKARMVVPHGKLPPGSGTVIKKSKADKMNKTETRCMEMLKNMRDARVDAGGNIVSVPTYSEVRFEAVTLYLANDLRYTPDMFCVGILKPEFYEVKGEWIYDRALHKFKAAVELFPSFSFYLAQWKKGTWNIIKYS
jgi:hypothetical protein